MQATEEALNIARRVSGGPFEVPDWTLVDVLRRTARAHGQRPAFLHADGSPRATWAEVEAWVQRVAHGLLALGLRPGDRVAVVSETRAEWVIADAAIMMAGGVTVSAFPTLAPATLAEALGRSNVRIAFVEDAATLAKASAADFVEQWILLEPGGAVPPAVEKRTTTLEEVERAGAPVARNAPDELVQRSGCVRAADPAAIVYTSGTTGTPKGVVLSHRNLVSNSLACIEHLGLRPHPVGLAFLPLAHSYQRQSAVVLTLLAGAVAFSAPARLSADLPRVRPTLLPAVPRLYERLHARIHEGVRQQPARRQRIFAWAEATAREAGRAALRGEPLGRGARMRHALFERLVYRRVRRMAGLDRVDLAITGAAAMREDLLAFFRGIGVPIVEGYGLTETAAPATVNRPAAPRAGTVGPPIPGVDVALAQDGEVLLSGPNVFLGYDNLPADTAEAFVELDGARWLRTGDIGALDDDGSLRIVDRKKELEILDTGKNVAPLPIEERLKASPFVEEAVVVAHGRKFVGCLVQPDYEALLEWAQREGVAFDAARTRRGRGPTGEEGVVEVDPALVAHPRVVELYARAIEAANERFATFERVKAFRVLGVALSAERGEVTPTLKKRRRAILEGRRADVEALFAPNPRA